MKGLLLKDFYTVITNMRAFLAIIIIFSVLPNTPIAPFAMIYAAMLPVNALAWDEQSKWNDLADMMPYSKFQLVFTKYIFGYGCLLTAFILSVTAAFIGTKLPFVDVDMNGALMTCTGSFFAGLMLMDLNLPLMYRIGVEKGRLLFGIITGGFMLIFVTLLGFFDGGSIGYVPTALIVGIGVAAAVVLSVISIVLSVKWYGKNK